MGVGKYSPTVGTSYSKDQDWYEKNGGGYGNGKNPDADYDDDGYDSYGYNAEGYDRAGNTEYHYESNYERDSSDEFYYPLVESVQHDWSGRCILELRKAREDAAQNPAVQELFRQLDDVKDILQKANELERKLKQDILRICPKLMLD
jgi:hypothetical protein